MHVIDGVPKYIVSSIPSGLLEKRKADAEHELHTLAAQYKCTDTVVLEGKPATEILEYASTIKADLIVLNSHDPDISDYILGSVASRVARRAHCSIHIVRH